MPSGKVRMAVVEKQQQHPEADYTDGENVAYMANQVSSKCTQKSLRNDVEKTGEAGQSDTSENKNIAVMEEAMELDDGGKDTADIQLCNEGFTGSGGRELAAGDHKKENDEKKMESVVMEDTSVSVGHKSVEIKIAEDEEVIGESVEQFGATTDEGMKQLKGCNDKETVVDTGSNTTSDETIAVVSLPVDKAQSEDETCVDKVKDVGETESTAASSVPQEVMESVTEAVQSIEGKDIITDDLSEGGEKVTGDASGRAAVVEPHSFSLEESNAAKASRQTSAEVKEAVGLTVASLVDDVVDSMDETVSLDAEPAKVLRSPVSIPHLSADEAMELLEAHQDDDNDLLPEQDDITDVNMEAEPKSHGYQWFDGDDEDDEEMALEVPSVLDVAPETTDDAFGFGGVVALPDVAQTLEEHVDMKRNGSADTRKIPGNRSRSSSSASSSSSSSAASSSPSYCSTASSSEDESEDAGSKKRRLSGNNGPRKLLQYKKQKRVRSSEPSNPSPRRLKRKRKIPKPVIPSEFAVFDAEAADPILKGSYAVRKNRRACFQGNWGFTEEAFHDDESISPFEYTSQARVLQSRRKDDKRPISGMYGGFFKLRQFNGSLVKVREDQVDLQFLPMPSSDEEDEDEDEDMKGDESDEGDGYEAAASRYIVLGKGKNRFGRFLIRGYLSPESGRLTVKRRYLE